MESRRRVAAALLLLLVTAPGLAIASSQASQASQAPQRAQSELLEAVKGCVDGQLHPFWMTRDGPLAARRSTTRESDAHRLAIFCFPVGRDT